MKPETDTPRGASPWPLPEAWKASRVREWQGNATATTNVIGAHDVPDEVHVAARLWTTADGWEGTLRGNYPAHWLVASKDAPLRLTLDDGTVGSAYVTGHSEHDSEITSAIVGVGPAPFD